jgi:hypothetical protein
MWSETAPYLETLRTSVLLIVIASFGGLVLFGLKMAEHFNRPLGRKLSQSLIIAAVRNPSEAGRTTNKR